MSDDEFREALARTVRLEVDTEGDYLVVKLVSTEINSSFDPACVLKSFISLSLLKGQP